MTKKKRVLLLALCAVVLLCSLSFVACDKATIRKYNAVLYDNVKQYVKVDVIKEHLNMSESGRYAHNNAYFIVQTQEDFDKIFTSFPAEINFDRQTVLLEAKGFCTDVLDWKLKRLKFEDRKLCIYYDVLSPPLSDNTSSPHIRYIALVMNKVDIDEFDFKVIEKLV